MSLDAEDASLTSFQALFLEEQGATDWQPSISDSDSNCSSDIDVDEDKDLNKPLPEGQDLLHRVHYILRACHSMHMDVASFLDALSWGSKECVSDPQIKGARSALFSSPLLPGILRKWWRPPRQAHKVHTQGAGQVMTQFSRDCLMHSLKKEIQAISKLLHSPPGAAELTEEALTSLSFKEIIPEVVELAPELWTLLRSLGYSVQQEKHNTQKNPDKIIFTIIAMLCYTRNKNCGRYQKIISIYLKFKGLSAKAFDTLHALGLTMSYKWTGNAAATISKNAMDEVVELMNDLFFWIIAHDNMCLPFNVYSQRTDNQTNFGNGCAATAFVKRSVRQLPPEVNQKLKEFRACGLESPLEPLDIWDLETKAGPRLHQHTIYQVLRALLDSPQFDLPNYYHRSSPHLNSPITRRLSSGPENITLQYLMGSVNIPEASYADNERLVEEFLGQLHLGNADEKIKTGLGRIIFWLGDQLTVDRLRGLFRMRAEDFNSFDRLDWMVVVFGWLHLMMAFANSLHKQYFGNGAGRGISQAIDVLKRKGMQSTSIKGTFHHDIVELIYIMTNAHLRLCWLDVANVQNLSELSQRSPEELLALAEQVTVTWASAQGLSMAQRKPANQRDQYKEQIIMWNRDALQYIVLDQAMKYGDVGVMEDMLPSLLYRFVGGRNSKYSIEVLELLQGLHREWPPEVREFVTDHCWLMNSSGKPDGFKAFDLAQEGNIKDIKTTYHSQGPSINWAYLKKLHPAIRVIREVSAHIEAEFVTLTRGKQHGIPKTEKDIHELQKTYRELYEYNGGREMKGGKQNKANDFLLDGAVKLQEKDIMVKWVDNRTFRRATDEDFTCLSDSDEEQQ